MATLSNIALPNLVHSLAHYTHFLNYTFYLPTYLLCVYLNPLKHKPYEKRYLFPSLAFFFPLYS